MSYRGGSSRLRHHSSTHIGAAGLSVLLSLCLCVLYGAAAYTDGLPTAAASDGASSEVLFSAFPQPGEGVDTSAEAHLLMEAGSGAVLAQKNADKRLPMASTTKIMTALTALRSLPLDTPVTVTEDAVGVEGSSVYLVKGEVLTLEQLLYALLLESANDAAVAIAIAVSGSVSAFADTMNESARSLGLTDTHFVNPHGLDDEQHYTTARELALIARAALDDPVFREIVSTRQKTIPLHGNEGVRLLLNHNKLLRLYDGCIGVKTGFTKHTGRCLVSAAERDGVRLIAVTLGCPDDWHDHAALLDYGFSLCESVTLAEPGACREPMWVESGTAEYVMVENREGLTVTLPRARGRIRQVVERPRFAFAPVAQDEIVGRMVWLLETDAGTIRLGEVPLYAVSSVDAVVYKRSLWDLLFGWIFHPRTSQ
ncbi:MAG: D-alanyl-D-alanine carboxypeptidase [Clostridia bacterium]|nr:D-alanyl-D-alanine carboxypeptidase [Clostridia bacterium]